MSIVQLVTQVNQLNIRAEKEEHVPPLSRSMCFKHYVYSLSVFDKEEDRFHSIRATYFQPFFSQTAPTAAQWSK